MSYKAHVGALLWWACAAAGSAHVMLSWHGVRAAYDVPFLCMGDSRALGQALCALVVHCMYISVGCAAWEKKYCLQEGILGFVRHGLMQPPLLHGTLQQAVQCYSWT